MRIAVVTAGLMLAGGIFGTIAGTLVLLAWQLRIDGLSLSWASLGWSVFFGVLGALLGPLAAWVLMRRVPLWLAVGGTTAGTFASGGLALVVTGHPGFAMAVGVAGFMLTRRRTARQLSSRGPPPDPEGRH